MPIHLIWGDDSSSRNRDIEKIIKEIVHPSWKTTNISRFDGDQINQINQALQEVRTPPFGEGSRAVVINKSPFCNGCSSEIGKKFENIIDLIPKATYLILSNSLKPDGRLKTTKLLQKLIKSKKVTEKSFLLPAIWDLEGQKQLVIRTAKELNLSVQEEAVIGLVEAIGTDSSRLISELEKLSLLEESKSNSSNEKKLITLKTVHELTSGIKTNSLQIGDSLLRENIGDSLVKINALLDNGEPALRIVASLTTQIRGWLWVSLLEKDRTQDINMIAKSAGIANPKRIYIIRKQIQGKTSGFFMELLHRILEIEVSLKKGMQPSDAFKDALLTKF